MNDEERKVYIERQKNISKLCYSIALLCFVLLGLFWLINLYAGGGR